MRYPLDELLDKRSIIQLKIERIDDNEERKRLIKEFGDYTLSIAEYIAEKICTREQVEEWHHKLYEANGKIWDLEANIRKGQIGDMSFEEVGRTAIEIREANGIRVRIKSEIVRAIGQGYEDIKKVAENILPTEVTERKYEDNSGTEDYLSKMQS